jgi:hypothetical protein
VAGVAEHAEDVPISLGSGVRKLGLIAATATSMRSVRVKVCSRAW